MGSHEAESEPEEPFICSITGGGGGKPSLSSHVFPRHVGESTTGNSGLLRGKREGDPFSQSFKKKKKNLLLNILSRG